MNEFLKIFRQFGQAFAKMSSAQKMSIGLVFFSSIVIVVAMVLWLSQPDFTVLYANLDLSDAAAIKQKLDEMNIPVKVKGNVILVPSKYVYEARLSLASDGLPHGGTVGYEIFDKSSALTSTTYLQHINYKRALEGELAKSIQTIRGIRQARVHLVLPKKELFSEEKTPASASVVLDGGSMLTKRQLQGIVHLVASSVEGLSPENITVVDSYGNLLYGGMDTATGLTDAQLDVVHRVEKYLENKASTMLTGILGPGKAIVRVSADLDFTQIEKREEKYDPESLVPRSEESSKETIPSANGQGSKEHSITNYEMSKTVAHIVESTGNIKRLAVAVVIDGKYEEKNGKRQYVPRSDEEKEKLKELVAQAVGLDPKRGDTISINEIPFDKSAQQEQEKEASKEEMISLGLSLAKYIGGGILVLIAIFMIQNTIKTISNSLPKPPSETPTVHAKRPKEPNVSELIGENYDLAADVVRDYLEGEEGEG